MAMFVARLLLRRELTDVPCAFSQMMARSYLSQATFVAIKNLPAKPNMRTLLETIAGASEFSGTRFRQGDKGALGKVNKVGGSSHLHNRRSLAYQLSRFPTGSQVPRRQAHDERRQSQSLTSAPRSGFAYTSPPSLGHDPHPDRSRVHPWSRGQDRELQPSHRGGRIVAANHEDDKV